MLHSKYLGQNFILQSENFIENICTRIHMISHVCVCVCVFIEVSEILNDTNEHNIILKKEEQIKVRHESSYFISKISSIHFL